MAFAGTNMLWAGFDANWFGSRRRAARREQLSQLRVIAGAESEPRAEGFSKLRDRAGSRASPK